MCPVCLGHRIISELTGKPPNDTPSLGIKTPSILSPIEVPSILAPIKFAVKKHALLEELGITPEEKSPEILIPHDFGNEKLIDTYAQEIVNDPNIPSITKASRFYDRLISFDLVTGSFTDLETYLIDKLNKYLPPNTKLKTRTTQNPTQDVSNIQSRES
jgi:hypothetical protein